MTESSEVRPYTGGRGFALASLIDRAIVQGAAAVAVVTTLALFLSIGAEVVSRYGTGRSFGWTSEMPNLLFPWMTMAGIVLAAQFGRHIVVDLGIRLLPARFSRLMLIGVQIPVAVIFAYLSWTGISILEVTASERFPATRITANWAYLSFVVGFALLTITAVTTAVKLWLFPGDPFAVRDEDAVEAAE